ncbi:MAG: hypothetical protein ABIU05_13425 [Nitrospirales bacterium]
MCLCNFCGGEFQNSQAVNAHLRRCENYQKIKDSHATRMQPVIAPRPNSTATAQVSPAPTWLTTASTLADQIARQVAGPDEATRLRQKREALLAGLCSSLVDWYHPREGNVTQEMAAAAKVAILDELGVLPIESLPQTELTLRGTVIRNRIFGPYIRQQQEQRAREQERQRQDTLRHHKDSETRARRITRKAALVELGLARGLAAASSRGIRDRALALLEWEVRARLEAWLVGDETEQRVDEIIEASIERPLLEWEGRVKQIQIANREKVLNQCLTLALPVVEAAVPWASEIVVTTVCEILGVQPPPHPTAPAAEANVPSEHEPAAEPAERPTPSPIRRDRRSSTSSDGAQNKTGPLDESVAPEPSIDRTAAR